MKVLGVEIYDQGFEQAVNDFLELISQAPKNLLISPSDANVLVESKLNPDFKQVLCQFFWNLPDGVPTVWILKLKGAKNASRCSGPDFFKEVILKTASMPFQHFFCGGAAGVAEKLAQTCKNWGNTNISGIFSPPFEGMSEQDMKLLAHQINEKNTNIVWVGLGAPKQIYFSHNLSKHTNVQAIIPIGAAFDFHTNRIKKAPKWLQKLGLEWFFRLLKEPKRMTKRYGRVVPLFIIFSLVELFRRKKVN